MCPIPVPVLLPALPPVLLAVSFPPAFLAVLVLPILGVAIWLAWRASKKPARTVSAPSQAPLNSVHVGTFDEPTLAEVERAFEILLARGSIVGERSTTESLAAARVPEHAGPVFRALAKRFITLHLPEVDVRISLHRGVAPDDAIGGWRLAADPEEIDIRLAPPAGQVSNPDGEMILDATWSPRASAEVAAHSTMLHFLVRAVCGDRLPQT